MSSHPIHTKLRNQIVFDAPPTFTQSSSLPTLQPSQLGQMNDDQQAAVSKVLAAQDYALILGMPGTGKTTTIAHVIRALLAENKTILLTSFTHTAVDNILLKVKDADIEILRLGNRDKVKKFGLAAHLFCADSLSVARSCLLCTHSRLILPTRRLRLLSWTTNSCAPKSSLQHVLGSMSEPARGESRGEVLETHRARMCHRPIFAKRHFDVCIVDEASQVTLPTCLGPLRFADTFVLVGDHNQLPPLVSRVSRLLQMTLLYLIGSVTGPEPSCSQRRSRRLTL